MAHASVKLHKRLSLNDFLERYGTEEQCFEALYRWRWPDGFRCPHCGHDRHCELTNRKLQQCNRCRRQTSVTAGTVFGSTKLPLTLWFLGFYLMTQGGKRSSAMALHRHLGISYNAAWRMKRKLIRILTDPERPFLLSGHDEDDHHRAARERGGSLAADAPSGGADPETE